MELIPLDKLVKGHIYKLRCRNLSYGVYDGNDGFIGIRTKFNAHYLFTEYHWDTEYHKPHGTVRTMEDTGVIVPNCIDIIERYTQQYDPMTGREIYWNSEDIQWHYIDTGEICNRNNGTTNFSNRNLFSWLDTIEKRFINDGKVSVHSSPE